jgi:hypothetical protein
MCICTSTNESNGKLAAELTGYRSAPPLSFGHDLRGGGGLAGHRAGRLAAAGVDDDDHGAADGAHAALAQPAVHALRVEPVLAPRQRPAPVPGPERLQAHRALAARAGLALVVVARQPVKILGRQPLRAPLVLPRRRGAERDAPPERPEDDEDVQHEHRHDACDEEEHGQRHSRH